MSPQRLFARLRAAATQLVAQLAGRPVGFAEHFDRALLEGQRVTLRLAALEHSLDVPMNRTNRIRFRESA